MAASEDERVLDRVIAAVLDIGCGPGRHLLELARRGIDGLGLDVTPSAVRLARSRGATVVEGSIFATVPAAGSWGTALLLVTTTLLVNRFYTALELSTSPEALARLAELGMAS